MVNINPITLSELKTRFNALDRSSHRYITSPTHQKGDNAFPLLERGCVHEFFATSPSDAVSINGFALAMAVRVAKGKPIVWGLHEMMAHENGRPYGSGLHEMGLSPSDLLIVRTRDIQTLLAVGEEALRSAAVGSVLLSAWGEAKAFSLTASRRLALAAEAGDTTLFLARAGALPSPSAAETRWSVASCSSEPMEGGTPGRPSFSATLLRQRRGGMTGTWIMEWDREQRIFRPTTPLSGGLVSLAAQRSAAASGTTGQRAA